MHQPSLCATLGVNEIACEVAGEVFDLFCGAGGFSEGAEEAGARVVFACDADELAIEYHSKQHPDCIHWCCALPRDDLPFPTDGRRFHVHASPPCQRFSSAGRKDGEHGEAERLIRWAVRVCQVATTWSLEQVPAPSVLRILEQLRLQFRGNLAYHVFNFEDLGVPQRRKRVIAGSPSLIQRLQRRASCSRRLSIADAIDVGEFTHLRREQHFVSFRKATSRERRERGSVNVYKKPTAGDHLHRVDGLAPTVIAVKQLGHLSRLRDGRWDQRPLRVHELAALQTFEPRTWPARKSDAMRLIGNAVPPRVAELLLRP